MQTLSRKSPRTLNGRRSRATTAVAVGDIDRQRRDAGISARTLAVAAGVNAGYLSQIFAGTREPSIAVLSALSGVLGATLSVRVYPNTGPTIRDGIQARIVEELLRVVAPTWRPSIEVAVTRPARGVIDVVFEHPTLPIFVATEVHSRIDRLEQQVRWANEKARSLPSSDLWRLADERYVISQLLVLRSTVETRELARRFEATFRTAYPAASEHVLRALVSADIVWPGPGILWADVGGDVVRLLDRPPRGVGLGR